MEILTKLRLKNLKENIIGNCQKCQLCQTRTNIVFGSGNFEKKILIIGEAPGEQEDLSGMPFIGKAGQLLNQWLNYVEIDRDRDVYISNILMCRPPNNRNPEKNEIEICTTFLTKKINILNPRVIIALGKFSSCFLSNKPNASMGYLRDIKLEYNSIPLIATFHPSYILRKEGKFDPNAIENAKVIEDLLKAKQYL